jgi:hypothetical protein
LPGLSPWSRSLEKQNLLDGGTMKKLKLLVDVLRAMRLVMSYLGDEEGRPALPRAATRIGD